jgi:isopentenyl-diphosphate delta-isomerase
MSSITRRKEEHLDLALHSQVAFRRTNLFDCLEFVHEALPELAYDELDLGVELLGKSLRAPIVIAGMTGGSERAGRVNRELAAVAEVRGYGFGLGSQRPMLDDASQIGSYSVREVAPSALVLANIGAVQARKLSDAALERLVTSVGADALCVHLNPAQELAQPEGDRDFRGLLARLEELVQGLHSPVVVKETGCGISRRTAERLKEAGIRHLDVSGAGGTSWVAVELLRLPEGSPSPARVFAEWGIPTAASVAFVKPFGFETLIATGGIRDGLEAAKALKLGAHAVGIARPVLKALDAGGRAAVIEFFAQLEQDLRTAMLLVGAARVSELKQAPCLVHSPLSTWLELAGAD